MAPSGVLVGATVTVRLGEALGILLGEALGILVGTELILGAVDGAFPMDGDADVLGESLGPAVGVMVGLVVPAIGLGEGGGVG